MSIYSFNDLFKQTTGGKQPFAYQTRLACGDKAGDTQGTECISRLIDVPTGCGKTAAVVLAWMWNRVHLRRADWPRRLVYCLPMRTLVEQTQQEVKRWLGDRLWDEKSDHTGKVGVHVLMGGEDAGEWDEHPEADAVLIGTQDMLLSRALNRGYGMSRYRWPMHFGLLNNDCLWGMDETQLMGPGLATTAQLDAFRVALWGTEKPCLSWWMSATVSGTVFDSTDRRALAQPAPEPFTLTANEREELTRAGRLGAEKRVTFLKEPKVSAPRDGSGILDRHQEGRITLVIVNTVPVAMRMQQEILDQLQLRAVPQIKGRKKTPALLLHIAPVPPVLLLHGRFRPPDRQRIIDELNAFMARQAQHGGQVPDHPGIIVVSTQVIEAGFDLSASRLWSEIAPWPSVVQRLGRLNREGKQPDAQAFFWIPKKEDAENGKDAPNALKRIGPYPIEGLNASRSLVRVLTDRLEAGENYGSALASVLVTPESRAALETPRQATLRPDDLHGLFSTEPDLAGGFTNIAPYVRQEDRNADVFVYWRAFKSNPTDDETATDADAGRNELVSVPYYELARFLKTRRQCAFLWQEDSEGNKTKNFWQLLGHTDLVPGMELLLPVSAGGYLDLAGWTGDGAHHPTVLPHPAVPRPRFGNDPDSAAPRWQTLGEHTGAVEVATLTLIERLDLPAGLRSVLLLAARWHDAGKAHQHWQKPLLAYAPRPDGVPWGKFSGVPSFRPGLRHEAASLLAAWERWTNDNAEGFTALALYLIACHHGKVRTALRSNGEGVDLFGLYANDPPVLLPDGSALTVSVSLKSFAGQGTFDWTANTFTPQCPSWPAVVAELLGPAWRDDPAVVEAVPAHEPRQLGPFRLAYLETVFRAADARASGGEFLPPSSAVR